jgi:predicted O-methyltransferase YrrM
VNKIFRALRVPKQRNRPPAPLVKPGTKFEVDCWALSELLLNRVIPKIGVRPYPLNEQMLMAAAVAFVEPKLIIEWGTHLGKSARLFWETKEALGLDCKIYTIDSMETDHPEFPGAARGKHLGGTDVEQIVGDGAAVAADLLNNTTERVLVYVDGDHSRETTKRDLALWSKLPPGSGLLAHDVLFQTPSSYNIGPWQSLQELIEAEESTISHIQWQLLGLPGMALVCKR